MTSGWKSGLDSSAICLAAGYAATEKSQAYWRCGKSGPRTGKADRKMEDRNISVPDPSVSSFQAVYQARISPAEGRMQKARAKPPKATSKPYTRHILGIDSGVQSHPKATPKPPPGAFPGLEPFAGLGRVPLVMNKSLGAKTLIYPAPVLVVGTYDKDGKPNVMTASWGGVCCSEPPCVAVSLRKATYSHANILAREAFTI